MFPGTPRTSSEGGIAPISFRKRRQSRGGFNLVEIAIALAIMSFSCTCLLGLLPASLAAYHQATSTTIESQIVQAIANDFELDNFSTLNTLANSATAPAYYYDHEGQALPTASGAFYTANVTFSTITSSNSPANLDTPTATTVAAYNVRVSITSVAQANAHVYSLIIANNGL